MPYTPTKPPRQYSSSAYIPPAYSSAARDATIPPGRESNASSPGGTAKFLLWKAVTAVVLAPIYCSIIAAGLREIVPALGLKLYKLPIPGFPIFGEYVETRRLDLAMGLAVFLLFAVWWLWERVILHILSPNEVAVDGDWDPDRYYRLVLILGAIILFADGLLFYYSVTQTSRGGDTFSFTALIATAAYVAVIVFISLVSLNLRRSARR